MRKMTKMAVTLAAMSAMTVAAASMTLAVGAGWSGTDKDGWEYTQDGVKLKNTWAEIDGIWYYFHKDGTMAQDEIVYIDGESYFFDEHGTMATGWQQIKSSMDAYGDVEIDEDLWKETNIASQEDWAYDYNDYVWCYFFENGTAAENEWFEDETGLWYYFDELVMVMNTMNYAITPDNYDKDNSDSSKIYGFDENGAMLVGWNWVKNKQDWKNAPTADAEGRTWYYYASNGAMQKKGWKKIGENWYLFAEAGKNAGLVDKANGVDDAYALLLNSYVTSYPKANEDPEFFYLDEDGKMQSGVVTLPKKLNVVTFYDEKMNVDSEYNPTTDSGKPEIYFGSNGAATEKLVNGRYYTLSQYGKTLVIPVDFDNVEKLSNTSINVMDAVADISRTPVTDGALVNDTDAVTGYDVKEYYGRVIKEAFIGYDGDELYLADADGDIITSKAVMIEEDAIVIDDKKPETTADDVKSDAFILFDRYGEAYTGYEQKNKSVTIGGKTYWSTGNHIDVAGVEVSVFSINKLN